MEVVISIYRAHSGRGTPYVVMDADEAPDSIKSSPDWSRRNWSSLPGYGSAGFDWPCYVANAERVGVLGSGIDSFGVTFGQAGLLAEAGEIVDVIWEDQL